MEKQFVTTSASPHIVVETSGDLRIKGQDAFEVSAKSDSPELLTLESREDEVVVQCKSDCSLRVPRAAVVHIKAVRGDAVVKALDGELTIDEVDGTLELRNIGMTTVKTVRGELSVKNVEGSLTIEQVAGDIAARRIQGDFIVSQKCQGNLNLSDVGGSAKANASGNIFLRLDPAPGHEYEFTAQGNLFCRLPDDTSAEISIPKAAQVMVEMPGMHASAPVQTPYALTLGEGDAHITFTATGNVVLDTHAPDWDMQDFDVDIDSEVNGMADVVSEQITQQVESQMRMIEEQLNSQLSNLSMRLSAARLSEEQAHRIEERARQASERAAARAKERVRRAQERMEQKFAAAQRKIELKAQARERAARHGHHGFSFHIPTPPTPLGEPVSEDERLMILRMLEEKRITMEQAEELLSALESKE